MKEFGGVSFFEQAVTRALKITPLENVFVVTNSNYKFHCMNQSHIPESNIIIEPTAKNTLGAILLWIESGNDEDVYLVLSSDHIIKQEEIFAQVVKDSVSKSKDSIIIFGIKPTQPHTWYGYINFQQEGAYPFPVINFKEKPNEATAKTYIENGYYWNAGIFAFRKNVFMSELKKYNKEYFELIKNGVLSNFEALPDLSIDYW